MQAEEMSCINLMKGKENTVRVTEIPFLATDIEMRKINQTHSDSSDSERKQSTTRWGSRSGYPPPPDNTDPRQRRHS